MRYKRIFLIVFDSLGIGNGKDAKKFDDVGSNTLNNVLAAGNFHLPCLEELGFLNLSSNLDYHKKDFKGIICKLNEAGAGKDSVSGHYEMMGLNVEEPPITFTDTGFPKEFIEELEEKWGRKIIGNKSASGTEIIKELGERQLKTGEAIVYTSADSVLQIAANESVIMLKELYKMCEIAREVSNSRPEWKVDRIIARPFIGTNADNFTRDGANRHDYANSPFASTYLDNLKEAGYDVIAIGKINALFNGQGITYFETTKSNIDGMDKTIKIAKNVDFKGLCFVNLVEFDSEFGHRRNPIGYLRCLEDADVKMRALVKVLRDDDLLIITADHGNDPTFRGTDHTREQVPFLAYSKTMVNKGYTIASQDSFGVIGATIIDNFGVEQKEHQIGKSLLNMVK